MFFVLGGMLFRLGHRFLRVGVDVDVARAVRSELSEVLGVYME